MSLLRMPARAEVERVYERSGTGVAGSQLEMLLIVVFLVLFLGGGAAKDGPARTAGDCVVIATAQRIRKSPAISRALPFVARAICRAACPRLPSLYLWPAQQRLRYGLYPLCSPVCEWRTHHAG
jgi:hypothetical protein